MPARRGDCHLSARKSFLTPRTNRVSGGVDTRPLRTPRPHRRRLLPRPPGRRQLPSPTRQVQSTRQPAPRRTLCASGRPAATGRLRPRSRSHILKVRAEEVSKPRAENELYSQAPAAFDEIEADLAKWRAILPAQVADFFAWCFEQSRETLLALLASTTARAINAKVDKPDRTTHRHVACDSLANRLAFDPHAHASLDRLSYFGRTPKARFRSPAAA